MLQTVPRQTKCLVMLPFVLKTCSHRPAIMRHGEEIKMSFPLFIKGPWPSGRLGQYSKHHAKAENSRPWFNVIIFSTKADVFFHCVCFNRFPLQISNSERKRRRGNLCCFLIDVHPLPLCNYLSLEWVCVCVCFQNTW